MCGISVSYATDNATPSSAAALQAQVDSSISTITHRGPDSTGTYVSPDGRVAMGHVRLSIIDLVTGQQPLHDDDYNVHVVVAGELYDYERIRAELEAKGSHFKTHSDSELVVHLYKCYGLNLLTWLRGEFAFVLYDSRRDLLFAARDRFGIKPLYYSLVDGRLLISSEVKAMRAFGWKPEWDVESVIQMGDLNDDRTVFKGVFKVPMGHSITFRRTGHLKIQAYWDHSYAPPTVVETRSVEEMIEGVRERLVEAVRLRLRSDVPLGLYLSGGIDSAAVAGIAASLLKEKDPNAKLATFTLAFPQSGALDEGPIARRMAATIGADVHMIEPTEADLVGSFEPAVWHAEQPTLTLHGAGKVILSKFVQEQGYKVILSGEGSDEVFGGYSFLLLDYLRATDPASVNLGFPLPAQDELDLYLKAVEAMKPPQDHVSISNMSFTDAAMGRDMFGGISTHRIWTTSSPPPDLFTTEVLQKFGGPEPTQIVAEGFDARAREKAITGQWHPLHMGLYSVSKTMLSNGILNYVGERSEMANSIEGRPPFLDHKLVEYANTLPPSIKVRPVLEGEPEMTPRKWSFIEKWVLRQAVRPYITDELYYRKKSQYNVPIPRPAAINGEKVYTALQVMLKERVTEATVRRLGFANWDHIKGLLHDYLESPESPVDGGLDKRARTLLYVWSLVILQDRFDMPTAHV